MLSFCHSNKHLTSMFACITRHANNSFSYYTYRQSEKSEIISKLNRSFYQEVANLKLSLDEKNRKFTKGLVLIRNTVEAIYSCEGGYREFDDRCMEFKVQFFFFPKIFMASHMFYMRIDRFEKQPFSETRTSSYLKFTSYQRACLGRNSEPSNSRYGPG